MKTAAVRFGTGRVAGRRMDAPFFLNDAKAYLDGLSRCPYDLTTVGDESKEVFFGSIFSRCFVKDVIHGVPYLRASEIQKADLSGGGLFLANRQAADLEYLRFKKGMILVTCSGTLGKCAYADSRYEDFIGTHDLIRIVPQKSNLLPGVLYAFLAGRFGFAMLTHSQYGSVILHTNPDQVRTIQIPVFPDELQKRVNRLVLDSARLREEADAALKRAVGLFERKAGMAGLEKRMRTGTVRFLAAKDAKTTNRFDAHYRLGRQILDAEKANCHVKFVTIASVAKRIFIAQRGKRVYTKNGIPFVSTAEMVLFNTVRHSSPISRFTDGIDEMIVNENDILVSCDGTVGRSVIVGADMDGIAVSHGALRILVDERCCSPFYLYCFLRTAYGFAAMCNFSYGSVIQHINDEHVGSIEMPLFGGKVYESIVADVREYKEKLARAAMKENEAIGLVESEIARWQEGGV